MGTVINKKLLQRQMVQKVKDNYDGLSLEKLKNVEFQMQEIEDDTETTLNDKFESLNNLETNNNVEAILQDQQKAMLTQVIHDENDDYYEQYTIYPLYEKKANKSATALYQMLKVQDLPLTNREKNLDVMCFPDLYPFEELHKAFETAKQLVQCLDDNLQKQQSQDNPENPIGVQNIEAGEAMQDFKDLGDKVIREIDVSEMIAKLNRDQKRVFDKVINTVQSDKSVLRLYVSGE
ncbi:dna repair and recombination protein mitochondrial, partial [Lasius niger]